MRDLRILEILDVLPVTSVSFIESDAMAALAIRGEDFTSVRDVFINDVKSPSVVIQNSKNLLAQVPQEMVGTALTSLVVTSERLTRTQESLLEFSLPAGLAAVSGMERLVQTFVKLLLQGPSTLCPVGGGLLQAIRTSGDRTSLIAEAKGAVSRAKDQLLRVQSALSYLPLEEQLLYANLINCSMIAETGEVKAQVMIKNRSNGESSVELGF